MFFTFAHFAALLVPPTTCSNLFCSGVDNVSTWWQIFVFKLIVPISFQDSYCTFLSSQTSWNNQGMIAKKKTEVDILMVFSLLLKSSLLMLLHNTIAIWKNLLLECCLPEAFFVCKWECLYSMPSFSMDFLQPKNMSINWINIYEVHTAAKWWPRAQGTDRKWKLLMWLVKIRSLPQDCHEALYT